MSPTKVTVWSSILFLWGRASLSLEIADREVSPPWWHTGAQSDTGNKRGVWEGGAVEVDTCWQRVGQDSRQAAFPAEILFVNRGYCVARIPAGLTIPSGLGFTNLMTKDAGKCLAEGIWQYLPVFCWELPPDHVALLIFSCLAVVLFVLRVGKVSRVMGRGSRQGGRRQRGK